MDRSVQVDEREFQMGTGSWEHRFRVESTYRFGLADQASAGSWIKGKQAVRQRNRTKANHAGHEGTGRKTSDFSRVASCSSWFHVPGHANYCGGPPYTILTSTIVISTLASRIARGSIFNKSSLTSTRSASLPRVIDPLSFS